MGAVDLAEEAVLEWVEVEVGEHPFDRLDMSVAVETKILNSWCGIYDYKAVFCSLLSFLPDK